MRIPLTQEDGKRPWQSSALFRIARYVVTIGIIVYLAYELRSIDWRTIWVDLPTSPLFYLLLVLVYCMLPASQVWVYRILWRFDIVASIPVFIRKRIMNKDVLGYSGEAYVYSWAVDKLKLPPAQALRDVRDQNIVSAAGSTTVSVVLLAIFLYSGKLSITDIVGESRQSLLWYGLAGVLVLALVIVRFRRYLFNMPAAKAAGIYAIHVVRMTTRQVLEILMWSIALPNVPVETWFTYAAASIIITRIPFLPNTDLVLLGVAVRLSGAVNVPEAQVFVLFGAIAAINRLLNLVLFSALTLQGRRRQGAKEV